MAPTRASTKSLDRRWCRERSSISRFDFASAKRRKARHGRSRAGEDLHVGRLLLYAVGALAVVGFVGLDAQPHFLTQRGGKEATRRMGLPAGGFHQLFQSGAAGPLHQFQHLGRFAALANTVRRRRHGFVGRFGALLGRGGLVRRLGLGGPNMGLRCGDFGLLGRLRLLGGRGLGRISICNGGCRHGACSFSGHYRNQDMTHSAVPEMQAISAEIGRGDGMAMPDNGDPSR